jgi:hypothetical protein
VVEAVLASAETVINAAASTAPTGAASQAQTQRSNDFA